MTSCGIFRHGCTTHAVDHTYRRVSADLSRLRAYQHPSSVVPDSAAESYMTGTELMLSQLENGAAVSDAVAGKANHGGVMLEPSFISSPVRSSACGHTERHWKTKHKILPSSPRTYLSANPRRPNKAWRCFHPSLRSVRRVLLGCGLCGPARPLQKEINLGTELKIHCSLRGTRGNERGRWECSAKVVYVLWFYILF